jgi:hypothetical protein
MRAGFEQRTHGEFWQSHGVVLYPIDPPQAL